MGGAWRVERGVPLPPPDPRSRGRVRRGYRYRWEELEAGDSVVVDSANAARAGAEWAHRNGCRFVWRKERDGTGWRVWRAA